MSDKSTTFSYNRFEAELNLADYRTLEKWEDAIKAVQEGMAEAAELERTSEKIKAHIDVVADAFDSLFGEGSAVKIFGPEVYDVTPVLEAFSALADFGNAQTGATAAHWRELGSKYDPQNREQKRAAQKKGK